MQKKTRICYSDTLKTIKHLRVLLSPYNGKKEQKQYFTAFFFSLNTSLFQTWIRAIIIFIVQQ